ncbi:MAG: type 1 glutamine amidotransferase [Lacunisphaera sp.]
MRVHVFQHVPFEGLAGIEPWLLKAGATITYTRFFESAALPALETSDWLVIMGGPMSVNDETTLPWLCAEKAFIAAAIARGTTILGVCLGAQLIASALGASIVRNREREIGWFSVSRLPGADSHPLGACFPPTAEVFHWHGETFTLPAGAVHLLHSAACENQAFAYGERVLGLQFHLETTFKSAREMIAEGRAELVPAPFVQTEEYLLESPLRYERLRPLLEHVLGKLATLSVLTNQP